MASRRLIFPLATWLALSPGTALTPTTGIVESLRIRKDSAEIAVIREAARRLSAVAEGVLADLGPGIRQREVARALEAGMWRIGFTKPAFDTIVASGRDSALPHARAGEAVLAPETSSSSTLAACSTGMPWT